MRKPGVLYRGASTRSLSKRGLERTAGIPLMPAAEDEATVWVYAHDHVDYLGGKPIVVKFDTKGLRVERDRTFDWQWNVIEDRIPRGNILEVEYL